MKKADVAVKADYTLWSSSSLEMFAPASSNPKLSWGKLRMMIGLIMACRIFNLFFFCSPSSGCGAQNGQCFFIEREGFPG
jgi:hypothetical protein